MLNTPVKVSGLNDIIHIFARGFNSYALKRDGTVWAWGDNRSGQLGNGSNIGSYTPIQVKDPSNLSRPFTNVVSIYASDFTSVAVKSDGTVWTWGSNHEGALGNDTDTFMNSNRPVQVKDYQDPTGYLTDVKQVSAGVYHFLALKGDHSVRGWGSNFLGQLGIGNQASYSSTAAQVLGSGGAGNLANIKSVGGGFNHSFAVGQDGTLWGWGSNAYGLLGNGTSSSEQYDPIPIAMNNVKQALGGVLTAEEKWSTLREGDSKQLNVTAQFTNKKTENVTERAAWFSYNPGIASVEEGKVVSSKKGKVKIKATYGGKTSFFM